MIVLEKINYQYDENYMIKDITINFQKGKIYTIMGMKGSGKSILAAIIGRVIAPDSGRLEINGRRSTTLSRLNYNTYVTMLREHANLFEAKTAVENIKIHLDLLGKKRSLSEILHLLEDSGVSKERALLKVSKLSKEEKMRYAIAQAFIEPTDYIIMDSPFKNNSNPRLRELLNRKIQELDKKKHCLIFFTEENGVLTGTDEVWGMNNGCLLFVKSTPEN